MKMEKIAEGIFKLDGRLATLNMVKGERVYGEDLIDYKDKEYRSWTPYRSKLSAAIMNGLKTIAIKPGSSVLYLGASTGTTPSHVSDIVGEDGEVYCVEISERSMRDLIKVCEKRHNLFPILQDARNVEAYAGEIGKADVIYQDVAAKDQDQILLRNCALLKENGYAYVAIKSQSIDVSKKPEAVYEEFIKTISSKFKLVEEIDTMPYDKMHLFVALQKI